MSVPLTPESYEPHVNEAFVLPLEDGTSLEFILTQVKRHRDNDVQRTFSLLFLGKFAGVLPQQICRLSHPRLGELDLFLVPLQQNRDGVLYESVFNLLKDEAR